MIVQPGVHVVCINDRFKGPSDIERPVKWRVYTVRDVMPNPASPSETCVLLCEIINRKKVYFSCGRYLGILEQAFAATRFKPLERLRIEDFVATIGEVA